MGVSFFEGYADDARAGICCGADGEGETHARTARRDSNCHGTPTSLTLGELRHKRAVTLYRGQKKGESCEAAVVS